MRTFGAIFFFNFYQLIAEELPRNALNFTRFFADISQNDMGVKCLLVNKSQLSQGREILRYYVKRSMPICLSTTHFHTVKVLDSSKRFELMLFSSSVSKK